MNKEFIIEQLKFICNLLNTNNIDYYVVGALGAYIDCNIDLIRNHDDIDIMIQEKDIDKLSKLFINTNYIFYDNRKTSNKILNDYGYTEGEEHEVYAQLKNTNFHIGFFIYSINKNEYSIIEYFKDHNKQKRIIRTLPIRFFNYQYNNNYKTYKGIKLKTVKVECIYKNKLIMNREKDIFDLNIFKDYIDNKKIADMTGKSKYRKALIEDI